MSPAKKAQGCGECEDSEDGAKTGPMYLGMSESQKGMFLMTEEGRGEYEGREGIPKTKVTEKAGIQGG